MGDDAPRPPVDPKAIYAALDAGVEGLDLDMVGKSLGIFRVRRRWWLDESDWSFRRRCVIAFIERFQFSKLTYRGDPWCPP